MNLTFKEKFTNILNNNILFNIFAILCTFIVYSSMYALRKPFTVATFENLALWGIDYKILLIISQSIGYTISKFLGIKIVSEMSPEKRSISIIILNLIALSSLLVFAIVPYPYNFILMLLNGLPLGMIWGLVFSYLEGRRQTELLGAGLSVSFIFSSGVVKSVGKVLMQDFGITQMWMPFLTGLIFFIPLVIFVLLLRYLPEPTVEDKLMKTERKPMNSEQRKKLFKEFYPGLVLLMLAYILLTTFRDLRDNFAAEIWAALGYSDSASVFTLTEIPVSILVLIILSLLIFIKDNYKALVVSHLLIIFGFAITGFSTYLFELKILSPFIWVSCVGFGLYLGYVPFNSMFFDRLIASFKYVSNVGFLIYLSDSFGYLGSISILIFKNFGYQEISWYNFFIQSLYSMSIAGSILVLLALIYFRYKHKNWVVNER